MALSGNVNDVITIMGNQQRFVTTMPQLYQYFNGW